MRRRVDASTRRLAEQDQFYKSWDFNEIRWLGGEAKSVLQKFVASAI